MDDNQKELGSAEYCSKFVLQQLDDAFVVARLKRQLYEAGTSDIAIADVEKAEQKPAIILARLLGTFSRAAVRAGAAENKLNIPQFFSNQTGIEDPCDPAVIEEMKAARGQSDSRE